MDGRYGDGHSFGMEQLSEPVKVLFLSAEPVDGARLRLGQEIRDIEQKLRVAPAGDSFQLVSQWAVRPGDLMEALMIHQPTVVHFSGHADHGRLVLENDRGEMQAIDGNRLAALLSEFSDTLRLVVLNACFTSLDFDILRSDIDFTVGTTSALSDGAAIRFSCCFYQALGFGMSVPAAYRLAKRQVTLEEVAGSEVFTLLVREGVDVSEPFVNPGRGSGSLREAVYSSGGAEDRDSGRNRNAQDFELERGERGGDSGEVGPVGVHGRALRGIWKRTPPEIQESLERFRCDYPDAQSVAFLMMRLGNTRVHEDIVAGVRAALEPLDIAVVRADDKQYHDDLFPNVLTYVYGCDFGIAVFERIETEEFNPNVALEVGYMFALNKDVCLLKDKTLKTLQVDLVGRLYRSFDPLDAGKSIPQELSRWLDDKGWGRRALGGPRADT